MRDSCTLSFGCFHLHVQWDSRNVTRWKNSTFRSDDSCEEIEGRASPFRLGFFGTTPTQYLTFLLEMAHTINRSASFEVIATDTASNNSHAIEKSPRLRKSRSLNFDAACP